MEQFNEISTIEPDQSRSHDRVADEDTALLTTNDEIATTHTAEPGEDGLHTRVAAALYSFFVLGLFMSSIGVMLTPIARHYQLSDIMVSNLFLVGPLAYVGAAQANSRIHARFGQRGIAFAAPMLHVLAASAIAVHPPFPFLLLAVGVAFLGHGLLDGSWCAWVAAMPNANRVSGFLHGSFSIGAAIGPAAAGLIMDNGRRPWWMWYCVLTFLSISEWVLLMIAFRDQTAARYNHISASSDPRAKSSLFRRSLGFPALWISASYFLADVGTETAISGWIVTFMMRSRHASERSSSLAASAFWSGMAVGRLVLGALTDYMGVRRATSLYLIAALILQSFFAQTTDVWTSIAIACILGAFMGPMFPSGVVMLTGSLPEDLHVSAVSTTASVGQVGAAILPFAIGALIHVRGIGIFSTAVIACITLTTALWFIFARLTLAGKNQTSS